MPRIAEKVKWIFSHIVRHQLRASRMRHGEIPSLPPIPAADGPPPVAWIGRRLAMANVWNPDPVAEHMRCCWTAGPGRRFNEDAGRPSRWPSQASGMDKRGYFRSMMTDRRVIDRSDPTRRQIKEQGQA